MSTIMIHTESLIRLCWSDYYNGKNKCSTLLLDPWLTYQLLGMRRQHTDITAIKNVHHHGYELKLMQLLLTFT